MSFNIKCVRKKVIKIHNDLPKKQRFSPEQTKYILANRLILTNAEMAKELGVTEDMIANKLRNSKLPSKTSMLKKSVKKAVKKEIGKRTETDSERIERTIKEYKNRNKGA